MVSASPDSSGTGATLAEPIRRLRLSVKEATDSRDDSEALPVKVREVLENLVRVADAARGDGVGTGTTRPSVTYTKRSVDRNPRRRALRSAAQDAIRNWLLTEVHALTVELRSQHFAPETLQEVFSGPPGQSETPPGASRVHAGEKAVALAFEVASYVSLREAGPEAWARKGASVTARGSGKDIEAAVKIAQYLLGPSPVSMANDVTKMLGEAVANINKQRLQRCAAEVARAVAAYESSLKPGAAPPLRDLQESPSAHVSPLEDRPSVTPDQPSHRPARPSSRPPHPKNGHPAPGSL
ncbi:hypothetical protein OH768_20695 [Streptomyces sp. NBC_01622]|uniref:hypothetical protein n=1 Tax=Streptomyces sp. NBC_01622 TaxID=2975903 RepID=UPI00386EC5BF|nr:hypothetical protein OH768_20695 [Streptomyces sp. NBC_01622]